MTNWGFAGQAEAPHLQAGSKLRECIQASDPMFVFRLACGPATIGQTAAADICISWAFAAASRIGAEHSCQSIGNPPKVQQLKETTISSSHRMALHFSSCAGESSDLCSLGILESQATKCALPDSRPSLMPDCQTAGKVKHLCHTCLKACKTYLRHVLLCRFQC